MTNSIHEESDKKRRNVLLCEGLNTRAVRRINTSKEKFKFQRKQQRLENITEGIVSCNVP